MKLVLSIAALLLVSTTLAACAARAPAVSISDFYRVHAQQVEGSDVTFTLKGTRLADLRSGTERDALFDTVAAVSVTCPTFAESLFYVDCSDEPCGIVVSKSAVNQEAAWHELTCEDSRLADFKLMSYNRGGEELELAWVVASPPGTDVAAALDRFATAWPTEALYLEMKRQLGVASR